MVKKVRVSSHDQLMKFYARFGPVPPRLPYDTDKRTRRALNHIADFQILIIKRLRETGMEDDEINERLRKRNLFLVQHNAI